MAELGRTDTSKSSIEQKAQFSADFGAVADLVVSDDRLEAFIRAPLPLHGSSDIEPIKKLIKKRGIKFGIVEDGAIREFLKTCNDPLKRFSVARGIAPSAGRPAEIVYHFNTEHETSGKILEDGSIDFHSMGDSPFVKKGQLVAEKRPMENPKPGKDIFGDALPVGGMTDCPLIPGNNVEMSPDGLKLFAAIQGQPVLDIKGGVSVLKQFTVKGDVNFKTGNIDYHGNVVVSGAIMPGFTVKCEELTVNEIDGGIIRITGNLNVSKGVINADIETQGGVQARFVNNSKIFAYRNMMITREIMESRIMISGSLTNDSGRITSSLIAARKGMSVRQIGTEKAAPSTIRVGSDDHVNWAVERLNEAMERIQGKLETAIKEKMGYDEENNRLHVEVANQTFAQEKITKNIDFIEKKISQSDHASRRKLSEELKELEKNLELADERIKSIFKDQDVYLKKIDACDAIIQELNTQMAGLKTEKAAIVDCLTKDEPIPVLKIGKRVYSGTRVSGTQSSMVLDKDLGAGRFIEVNTSDPETPRQMIFQGA